MLFKFGHTHVADNLVGIRFLHLCEPIHPDVFDITISSMPRNIRMIRALWCSSIQVGLSQVRCDGSARVGLDLRADKAD